MSQNKWITIYFSPKSGHHKMYTIVHVQCRYLGFIFTHAFPGHLNLRYLYCIYFITSIFPWTRCKCVETRMCNIDEERWVYQWYTVSWVVRDAIARTRLVPMTDPPRAQQLDDYREKYHARAAPRLGVGYPGVIGYWSTQFSVELC